MPSWRAASAAMPSRQAVSSRFSADDTRPSSMSVTPLQADNTTAVHAFASDSTMRATRSKQAASATLEPPNLCTR